MLFCWTWLDIQTYVSSDLYLHRFSVKESIDTFFYLKWTNCFKKSLKFSLYRKKTLYCGYKTNFSSVSQPSVWQCNTTRTFHSKLSGSTLSRVSLNIYSAKPCVFLLMQKSQNYLASPFFYTTWNSLCKSFVVRLYFTFIVNAKKICVCTSYVVSEAKRITATAHKQLAKLCKCHEAGSIPCIHNLISLFFVSSPIAERHMQKWHWLKLRLCLHRRGMFWFTTIQRPTVFVAQLLWSYRKNCLYHEAWKRWHDQYGTSPGMLSQSWLKKKNGKLASGVFFVWLDR